MSTAGHIFSKHKVVKSYFFVSIQLDGNINLILLFESKKNYIPALHNLLNWLFLRGSLHYLHSFKLIYCIFTYFIFQEKKKLNTSSALLTGLAHSLKCDHNLITQQNAVALNGILLLRVHLPAYTSRQCVRFYLLKKRRKKSIYRFYYYYFSPSSKSYI